MLGRGRIPCDILFIGEAPGASEDVLGEPFIGPAGKLLDQIIWDALNPIGETGWEACPYRVAFTNVVACIPFGEDGVKTSEPPQEAIKACDERLVEFVRLCKPRLIVAVGLLSKKTISGAAQFSLDGKSQPEWLKHSDCLDFLDIVHPAAILRADIAKQSLAIKRCIVAIAEGARRL